MNVFLTGAAGFLGRHFREKLERDGHQVYGCDPRSAIEHPWIYDEDCREIFRTDFDTVLFRGADLVIHCAANVGGREQIDGNPLAVAENLSLDEAMFRWAVQSRPGRVVYISSSAAYPTYLQVKEGRRLHEGDIDLDNIANADNTYGHCKLTGEMLARLARAEGVPVTVIRPFSGYGEDQDPAYPFRAFMERAKAKEDPFVVWGDGTQTRDWIHVDDIVGATLEAVRLGIDGPINLGLGRPVDFTELALMTFDAVGYMPEIEFLTDKPSGMQYRVSDPSQLLRFYEPKVSLEEGIARALTLIPA